MFRNSEQALFEVLGARRMGLRREASPTTAKKRRNEEEEDSRNAVYCSSVKLRLI